MANQQHLDIFYQGVDVWNRWREERTEQEWREHVQTLEDISIQKPYPRLVDLSDANLEKMDLRRINLQGANLQRVRLVRADLREAALSKADLRGAICNQAILESANLSKAGLENATLADANLWKANLSQANLVRASLSHAFLAEADLRKAFLADTDFTQAILYGADLHEARVWSTIFGDVDLSEVKGLETLEHLRPSLIDIRTLARSSGRIPEAFLSQAGIEPAIIPALLALFHPYHGYTTWWMSEEPLISPWQTTERPQEAPRSIDEDEIDFDL